MIRPLTIQKSIYFTEVPISLFATVMVGFLANANLFVDVKGLTLSRYDGSILLFFFALFMTYIYVVSKSKQSIQEEAASAETISTLPKGRSIAYIVIGSLALFLGGKWVVDGAFEIALFFGLSETFIGLTVVAVGTSLPELVTSAVAAKKGQSDMAVGNVVGSNIFNILWILGLSSVIRPLPFDVVSNSDILMVIASSTLLIVAIVIGRKASIGRVMGTIFVLTYAAYLAYLVMRG